MTDPNPQPAVHRACLICGSDHLRDLPKYSDAHLVRCRECGLTFAGRRPSDSELTAHYQHYGSAWYDSPITRQRYNELLDSFDSYRRTNRILDIGCGAGFFLEEAGGRGWQALGTEYGAKALGMCRAKRLDVVEAPISRDMFDADSFDVITAFEVVEHLRDPADEAGVIAHALRPGGLFYCTTPNFNAASRQLLGAQWVNIGYPEHLCYFTTATLRTWLKAFDLVPTSVKTTGFSPTALRQSLTPATDRPAPGESGDERLRVASERSRALRGAKAAANAALSVLHLGDTIKAHFELLSRPMSRTHRQARHAASPQEPAA
jgi:2-polyprenyl-3-methyl-5-hydroxy-6-metoxy-1,4-benzoquinol methylase